MDWRLALIVISVAGVAIVWLAVWGCRWRARAKAAEAGTRAAAEAASMSDKKLAEKIEGGLKR